MREKQTLKQREINDDIRITFISICLCERNCVRMTRQKHEETCTCHILHSLVHLTKREEESLVRSCKDKSHFWLSDSPHHPREAKMHHNAQYGFGKWFVKAKICSPSCCSKPVWVSFFSWT